MSDDESPLVRIVTIITLGVILLASMVGLTIVAVTTDRDLFRAAMLTFGGVLLLGLLGGVSWLTLRRRHRWRVRLEHDENGDDDNDER